MKLSPITPPDEWAKRYGIQSKEVECPKCLHQLRLTIPVAIKGYRGLAAESCEKCGESSGIVRFVPVGQDKIDLWESLRPSSEGDET